MRQPSRVYKTLTIWSKNYNSVSRVELVDGYLVYETMRMVKWLTQLGRTGFWICLRVSREAVETRRKGSKPMLSPFAIRHTIHQDLYILERYYAEDGHVFRGIYSR